MKYRNFFRFLSLTLAFCVCVFALNTTAFVAAESYNPLIINTVISEYDDSVKKTEKGIIMGDASTSIWKFMVESSADYIMKITFSAADENSSSLEHKIFIDDVAPYDDMTYISYPRSYTQAKIDEKDISGNDLAPTNTQIIETVEYTVADPSGYHGSPCIFSLKEGEHTLTLKGLSGKINILDISFEEYKKTATYSEIVKSAKPKKINFQKVIEAELPYRKSSITLSPNTDRTSSQTSPQDSLVLKLNTIGGTSWQAVGQTLTYKFEIPEDGYYTIGMRYIQNFVDGAFVSRRITIDGKTPFFETDAMRFYYNHEWVNANLGNEDEDYLFYLTKGEHQLTFEVVLGDFSETLGRIQSVLKELNKVYREILLITGSEPDVYRDYALGETIPETIKKLEVLNGETCEILNSLKELSGSNSSYTAIFNKLASQLEMMCEDPEVNIPELLPRFKTNLGTLGTWLLEALNQPLQLDTITISGYGYETNVKKHNFFGEFLFQLRCFLASFVQDYDNIGVSSTINYKDSIEVWVPTGRDQAQIIRNLADAGFAKKYNVQVNLKLVSASNILPSVISGNGPDVYLTATGDIPIDFALRKAIMPLNNFENFDKVSKRFASASLVPYTYNNQTYALPETLTFPMFFYRTDIFEELKISVPETWDEFMKIIPVVQSKNMDIGVDMNMFYTLLYHYGGSVYTEDFKASGLSSDAALTAFSEYTELFTLYRLPVSFDFANRFRTGEMPCGIVNYTMYNQLAVFAPEIKGQWAFAPVPGFKQEDGSVKHISIADGNGCMIMLDTKKPELAWEFLKWWTDEETQSQYGLSMESLLGESAKQPTANINALTKMNWNSTQYSNLISQIEELEAVPNVPGGSYYTPRIISFAFQKVYNKSLNPESTLKDYLPELNKEIERKYNEFFK